MKRAAIITGATIGGLWALIVLLANVSNVMDGIAYQMPNAPRSRR